MYISEYPRGSEWRKWDLHVHTPFSYLNNQFGNDFDRYVKELFKKAIEKEVAVIGITDYFCIEGYKKIKNEYLKNDEKLEKLFSEDEVKIIKKIRIFPNIEFRLNKLVGSNRVNFHVVFSDEVLISDIEENFLHELDFVYGGNTFDVDEKWKLKINNLKDFGNKLIKEQPELGSNGLFVGMKCAVVDDSQIMDVLSSKKSKFLDKYLIIVPSDEDLSRISWKSQDHNVRKAIIQKSNCLFASNPNTIKWALGKFNDSKVEYIKEFKSLKACIWGSDSHSYESLFEPFNKRYTWIKADPTFEGLRQIIYEPEDRVKIQEEKPEQKEPYNLIDYVQFDDSKGMFTNKEILLNQNLNVIIGGKSTGKSILLREIARAISPIEVSRRLKDANLEDYKVYENDEKLTDEFIVKWVDGREDKRSNENRDYRKIIYIPQSYLNRLAEKEGEQSPVDELVSDILKNDNNVKLYFEDLNNEIGLINRKISHEIENLFENIRRSHVVEEDMKNLGDKEGINTYIKEIETEIKELQSKGGLNDKDIKKYEKLSEEIDGLKKIIHELNNQKKDFEEIIERKKFAFDYRFEKIANKYTSLREKADSVLKGAEDELNSFLREEVRITEVNINEKFSSLRELECEIKPLLEKVKNVELINERNKKLNDEKNKLNEILRKEGILNKIKEEIRISINNLVEAFIGFYNKKEEFKSKIEENYRLDQELQLNVIVNHKKSSFNKNFIEEVFNLKSLPEKYKNFELDLSDLEQCKEMISETISDIIFDNIKLKKTYEDDKKSTLQKLLQDWFVINYQIRYEGDTISQMSPGKKSFVLLRLIVELDKSKCPLLIDQPEDDLDNRSIYNDVVQYVRKKKKERQIIIATHNPNLVVATDAECVIVSNQDGEKNKNKKHKFEYVQGSLENTFEKKDVLEVLYKQGIKEHVCDILEGGEEAFEKRKNKYNFK